MSRLSKILDESQAAANPIERVDIRLSATEQKRSCSYTAGSSAAELFPHISRNLMRAIYFFLFYDWIDGFSADGSKECYTPVLILVSLAHAYKMIPSILPAAVDRNMGEPEDFIMRKMEQRIPFMWGCCFLDEGIPNDSP